MQNLSTKPHNRGPLPEESRQTFVRKLAWIRAVLRHVTLAAALALAPVAIASAQNADTIEKAWSALAGDGAVLIVRHAIAPGSSDPPGFRLEDCATQRNLSAEGRVQAERLGALLRSRGVRITKVISSPWCRTIDTARLMGFTDIEVNDALWNLVHNPPDRDEKVARARSLIRNWRGPGVLMLSTHGSTLQAVTGASYTREGGSLVVQPDPETPLGMRVVSPLPPPD
jgi:phosphohistidine phosphatase SixA